MSEKKKSAGRPRLEIDKKQFESLCALQCTAEEISSFFNCSVDGLRKWCCREYNADQYIDVYKKYSENGKISLRRNQLKLSETNASMAIWLGKQWLSQRDYADDANSAQVVADAIIKAAEKRESKK